MRGVADPCTEEVIKQCASKNRVGCISSLADCGPCLKGFAPSARSDDHCEPQSDTVVATAAAKLVQLVTGGAAPAAPVAAAPAAGEPVAGAAVALRPTKLVQRDGRTFVAWADAAVVQLGL